MQSLKVKKKFASGSCDAFSFSSTRDTPGLDPHAAWTGFSSAGKSLKCLFGASAAEHYSAVEVEWSSGKLSGTGCESPLERINLLWKIAPTFFHHFPISLSNDPCGSAYSDPIWCFQQLLSAKAQNNMTVPTYCPKSSSHSEEPFRDLNCSDMKG